MSARIAELAGTLKLRTLHMANTKRSPLAPEFCNSMQGVDPEDLHRFNTTVFVKNASVKPKASSTSNLKPEASSTSRKAQASSIKLKSQASSNKL